MSMKKILNKCVSLFLCALVGTISISGNVFAGTETDPSVDYNTDIDTIYQDVYNSFDETNINKVDSDETAYSVLRQNTKLITFNNNGTISVDYDLLKISNSLCKSDIDFLQHFVTRLNNLINLSAITLDNHLLISSVKNVEPDTYILARRPSISIMTETRNHAVTLKNVYDNAVFSTKHLVAGQYFAERVKSGGVWDYKSYLGTNTLYYVEDLNTNMTGEAIGNFHYGYVGRAVFSETTLKSAAGMYQIYSGTSSIKYWDSFFDDPRDQAQIQKGIDKYNAEH